MSLRRVVGLALPMLVASCGSFGGSSSPSPTAPDLDGGGADASSGGAPKRVYIVGGLLDVGFGVTPTNEVHSAAIGTDGSLGSWDEESFLPEARAGHTVVAVGRTIVAIGGGLTVAGPSPTGYAATLKADGKLGGWSSIASVAPVVEAAAASDGRFLHLLGGSRASSAFDRTALFVELGATPSAFAPANELPAGRRRFAAVRVDDAILSIGGDVDAPDTATARNVYIARVKVDGSLEAWETGAPLPTPLSEHAAVSSGKDVFVVGGYKADAPTAEVLHTTSPAGKWERSTELPSARRQHCAVAAGGFVYVIGGLGPAVEGNVPRPLHEVIVSRVAADGTLGPWKNTTTKVRGIQGANCAAL